MARGGRPVGWCRVGLFVAAGCLLLLNPLGVEGDGPGSCLPPSVCQAQTESALLAVTPAGVAIRGILEETCTGDTQLSCRPEGPGRPGDGSPHGGPASGEGGGGDSTSSQETPSPVPAAPSGRPGRPGADEAVDGPATPPAGEPDVSPVVRPPAGPPRNRSRQGAGQRPKLDSPPDGATGPPPGGEQANPPGSPGAAGNRNTTEQRQTNSSRICRKYSKPLLVTFNKVQYLTDEYEMVFEHLINPARFSPTPAPNSHCGRLSTIPGTVNAQGQEVKAVHVALPRRKVTGIDATKWCVLDVDVHLVTESGGSLTMGTQTTALAPGQVKFTLTLSDPDSCFCHVFDLDSCVPYLDIFMEFHVEKPSPPQSSPPRTTPPSSCKNTAPDGDCPMDRVDLGGESWLEYPYEVIIDNVSAPAGVDGFVRVLGRTVVVRVPQFKSRFSWHAVLAASREVDPEVGEVVRSEGEADLRAETDNGVPTSSAPTACLHWAYIGGLLVMVRSIVT